MRNTFVDCFDYFFILLKPNRPQISKLTNTARKTHTQLTENDTVGLSKSYKSLNAFFKSQSIIILRLSAQSTAIFVIYAKLSSVSLRKASISLMLVFFLLLFGSPKINVL